MDDQISLEQSAKEVMQSLPPAIRSYIAQGKYTPVAQNLMRQYKLRVDQGGVLEREILLLLLGLETPAEFMAALSSEAGLDKASVDGIARDINNQIFIPLRAEEMKASAAQKTPPADSGSHFKLQNRIPLPNRPTPSGPAGQPGNSGLRSALSQALGTKPFDPSRLLEDHEEPHIEFRKPGPPPARPVPPPPPNLPGQMPPAPPRVAPPAPGEPRPVPPPAAPSAPAVPAPKQPAPPAGLTFKSPPPPPGGRYAVDPYREPIDEEGK